MDQIIGKTECSAKTQNFVFFSWPNGQWPLTVLLACGSVIKLMVAPISYGGIHLNRDAVFIDTGAVPISL